MNMVKHEKNILRILYIKSYPAFKPRLQKTALRGVLLNLHPITTIKVLIIKISPRKCTMQTPSALPRLSTTRCADRRRLNNEPFY